MEVKLNVANLKVTDKVIDKLSEVCTGNIYCDTSGNAFVFFTEVKSDDFFSCNVNSDCKREEIVYFVNKSIERSEKVISDCVDTV